jgi:hypothetical protein
LLAVPAMTSLGVRTSSSILASLFNAQQGASSPKHLPDGYRSTRVEPE